MDRLKNADILKKVMLLYAKKQFKQDSNPKHKPTVHIDYIKLSRTPGVVKLKGQLKPYTECLYLYVVFVYEPLSNEWS